MIRMLLAIVIAAFAQEKSVVEQEYQLRHDERLAAEARLEETFLRMRDDFAARAGRIDETAAAIGDAIRAALPQIREQVFAARDGRTPQRAVQLSLLRENLVDALAATDLDPGFRAPLAVHLAEPLLPVLAADEPQGLDDAVRAVIADVWAAEGAFDDVWNRLLFQHVPEASAYAAAYAAYLDAGQKLERERSPDRYSSEGDRLPPGMVEVKGGSYDFGPHQAWARPGYDKKTHKINVRRFYVDRTEVTNADYHRFWAALDDEGKKRHLPRTWEQEANGAWSYPAGLGDHPVTGVSYNDAVAYAAAAGKRLPTEEEWEAAARGPKAFLYPWGPEYAAGRANDRDAGIGATAPVGSFAAGASPSGCVDLAGNVEEWTASTSEGDALAGPIEDTKIQVVIRGGNYNSNAEGVAATFRWISPGVSTRKANLGFRCAADPPKKR